MTTPKLSLWQKLGALIKKYPALKPVLAALALIILFLIVFVIIFYFNGPGIAYSISYGVLLGLLCGYLLQNNISQNYKIGTVGVFGGMGLDLMATSFATTDREQTINAVNSLGSFMGRNIAALFVKGQNLPDADKLIRSVERNITIGLWTIVGVLGLVLILASIFNPKKERD